MSQSVTVKYSETYDMATVQNKLCVVGIHTPSATNIKQLWFGLWRAFKYVKLEKCDVRVACASMLPADPLQIGTSAGEIAPQDMFNPILYKACSNESFEFIVDRVRTGIGTNDYATVSDASPAFPSATTESQFKAYYGLLAEPGWRKAMPQAGLEMTGLYPMVYEVLNNYGNIIMPTAVTSLNTVMSVNHAGQYISTQTQANTFRGQSRKMPRLPTLVAKTTGDSGENFQDGTVPRCFCACLVLPPSRLHELYYRMKIDWYITFSEVRTEGEWASGLGGLINDAQLTYHTNYTTPWESSKVELENQSDTVDVEGAGSLEHVMTSGV